MKPQNLSIIFRLPQGKTIKSGRVDENGRFFLIDENGNQHMPEEVERILGFDRPKGLKVQSRTEPEGVFPSVGGIVDKLQYDSIQAIDTNKATINDTEYAVSSFMSVAVKAENEEIIVKSLDDKIHYYIFEGFNENPEMLAISKMIFDIERSSGGRHGSILIVNDSELSRHEGINKRTIPLCSDYYLPDSFSIAYSSSDTGNEFTNRLIRFCDKQATEIEKFIRDNTVSINDMKELVGINGVCGVKYKYVSRDGLIIENPVVSGPSIGEGTKISLYGFKKLL